MKTTEMNPIEIQKTRGNHRKFGGWFMVMVSMFAILTFSGCQKEEDAVSKPGTSANNVEKAYAAYGQVNLVSDLSGYGPKFMDKHLANAWGIAAENGTADVWIASNHGGVVTSYDIDGGMDMNPILVPGNGPRTSGAPTGVVLNTTRDFKGAKLIFAGEDGIISSWKAGATAVVQANMAPRRAVYKGLTLANDGGANYLYAANFKGNSIDVFDANFKLVLDKPFVDRTMNPGFAPFNIQNINGYLYVTYAMQKAPENMDDMSGPGYGFVNVFKPNGMLVRRFASKGTLNSPWGIAMSPAGFSSDESDILIGNFGDGRINIFDVNGKFKGQLIGADRNPVTIKGLWALTFVKNLGYETSLTSTTTASTNKQLYFTAGIEAEEHGLFGYLQRK